MREQQRERKRNQKSALFCHGDSIIPEALKFVPSRGQGVRLSFACTYHLLAQVIQGTESSRHFDSLHVQVNSPKSQRGSFPKNIAVA
jgi:hypothetical protein